MNIFKWLNDNWFKQKYVVGDIVKLPKYYKLNGKQETTILAIRKSPWGNGKYELYVEMDQPFPYPTDPPDAKTKTWMHESWLV